MALAAGERLGPYEVLGLIGTGGMGEVYKAKDTRLDRTAAIKILPAEISGDPDRRARFEREARTIAALSHPHICTLYDVGEHASSLFLVMEHLAGETLAEKLRKGALPIEQALEYGEQIADALSAAHRAGIIHRDLKPANVMLTKSGVKLLDFGLAKPQRDVVAAGATATVLPTHSAPLSGQGTILGTLHYMAPEQLEGKAVDARTDIWALGLVLYEMITGKRAFEGQSGASLIAAILEREAAPLNTLQPLTPPAMDRIVRQCLAKAPDDRWDSSHDVADELQWIRETLGTTPVSRSARVIRPFALLLIALLLIAGSVVGTLVLRPAQQSPTLAAYILPPEGVSLTGPVAISPDGATLAFSGERSDHSGGLWLRRLNATDATLLPDTEGATDPFWKPDGGSLGFFARGKLARIDLGGGPPRVIATVGAYRGAAWHPKGVIVFSDTPNAPLLRVSDSGGEIQPVTALDRSRGDVSHRMPQIAPDGRILFLLAANKSCVAETSFETPSAISCLTDIESTGMYARQHLLYMAGRTLMSQPFDLGARRPRGSAVAVVQGVWADRAIFGRSGCSVAVSSDVMACRMGDPLRLAYVGANSSQISFVGPPDAGNPSISPDGKRLLVGGPDGRLWVIDGDTSWPLTREGISVELGIWRFDGQEVAFSSMSGGVLDVYIQSVERGTREKLLLKSDGRKWKWVTDWSRDGRWILFTGDNDIWMVSADGTRAQTVVATPATESQAHFSPDGKWIAYVSDESGQSEVYVKSLQSGEEPTAVTVRGGTLPIWRADGRELFVVDNDLRVLSVQIDLTHSKPTIGTARVVVPAMVPIGTKPFNYAVSPAGDRFVVTVQPNPTASQRILVLTGALGH